MAEQQWEVLHVGYSPDTRLEGYGSLWNPVQSALVTRGAIGRMLEHRTHPQDGAMVVKIEIAEVVRLENKERPTAVKAMG